MGTQTAAFHPRMRDRLAVAAFLLHGELIFSQKGCRVGLGWARFNVPLDTF